MADKTETTWLFEFIGEAWPITLAAFLGAFAAFIFQKYFESVKQKNLDFSSGKRAQFVLVSQFTALSNLNKQYLNDKREDENRFLTLHPITLHHEIMSIHVESLLYMLDDGKDADLLNKILIADQKFKTAVGVLEQRSNYHSDFQHRAAEIGVEKALDTATTAILTDMTNSLFDCFDDAMAANKEVFEQLFTYLKNKFPKKVPLQYEEINL